MERDQTRFQDLSRLGKLCIFSELFFGLCVGAWTIALNFHLSACGMSESQIGILLCLGYLVTAVTSFFVGRVGDKKGYPFVMASGMLLMGSALLLIACVRWLPLFYLGHGIYCAGLACAMSMEYNLPLSLVREDQRQYGYNLVLVFYFLGSIIGNGLCSVCLPLFQDQEDPYRYILMICTAVYWMLALLRGSMPRQVRAEEKEQRAGKEVFLELLGSRKIQCYLIYGCLTFGLLSFATGMLNLVLRLWHHMSDSVIGAIFSLNSVVGCLVLMLLPMLVCRVSLHRISSVALTLQCLSLAAMAFVPGIPFAGMVFLRTCTCNVLYTSVDSPMLQSVSPRRRGTYSGMRVFANYIGMSIASIASGLLVDLGNFRLLYLMCAGVALVQMLVYQLLCRPFLLRTAD